MRRKMKILLATLLMICFVGAAYGVTLWTAQQTITQTIEGAATGNATSTLTLPTGYKLVNGNYTFSDAVSLTTKVANLKFWINQTDTQMSSIASIYSLFTLHVRYAGSTTDFLVIDLRTETFKSADLGAPGTKNFDYFIEYCPAETGTVSYVITVSVTT